jgi:multidrug efflux pump subunit AcrA (membrane-fusion protein)
MKKIIVLILIAALLVGGVTLLKKRKAQLAAVKPAAVLPVVVDTATMARSPVILTLPAMGVVASDLSSTLSTKVTGRVLQVFKQEGDIVKRGEKLALIDARDLEAKKQGLQSQRQGLDYQIAAKREDGKAAKTALAAARETHGRTEELLKVKGASIEQFREEEANIARLEAQLAAAENGIATLEKSKETLTQDIEEIEALLSYATITSPIDGTLSERHVQPGDLAVPGKPLFSIAAGSGLYLSISLPEGMHAREIFFENKRLELVPKNQAGVTGLVQYVAELPDALGIVEGQYLNVRVVTFSGNDVLVPVDGLLSVNDQTFVFALAGGKAQKIPVHVKARGAEGVVVEEDLAGRKIIIAKPDILLRVATGAPVLAWHAEGSGFRKEGEANP